MTDIYQSPGDRLRFEILLKSLTEGSLNLAVLSEHDQVLDFYGNLFEERLRDKGENKVEFCFSTNSEKLVQKFNEILSELTLDEALEKDKKHAPRRFLVFRDSILMQDFELQLLARLVNGFPAGNISVILLINSTGAYRNKLDAFGKNLLQWEVETRAGEAKKPLENWVAEPTPEPPPLRDVPVLHDVAPAAKLLNVPTKPSWRVPGANKPEPQEPVLLHDAGALPPPPAMPVSAAVVATPALATASALPDTSREPVLTASDAVAPGAAAETPAVFQRPARQTPWGWMFLVLLMSLAVFGYMYRDLINSEVEQFKKYLLRGTPAAATASVDSASAALALASAPASAAPASASAAASVSVSGVVDAASAASTDASAALAASAPASSASAPAANAASASSTQTTQAVAVEPAATTAKPTKSDVALTDAAWLDQLPANGYVVQLAALDTEAEMQALKRSQKVYASARVMPARKKESNARYFILVAGPFANKAQADAFQQSNPLLSKGWLRSTKSLKSQFNRP